MAPKVGHDADKDEAGKSKDGALLFRLQTVGMTQTTYTTVLEDITMVVQRTYDQGYHVAEVLTSLQSRPLPAPIMQVAATGTVATAEETAQWLVD